jgi:hypothetical protein
MHCCQHMSFLLEVSAGDADSGILQTKNEQQQCGHNSKYQLSGSDPTILVTNTRCFQHEEIHDISYYHCIYKYAGKIYKYICL